MAKRPVVLTVSIYDEFVLLSLINKSLKTLDSRQFKLTKKVDNLGIYSLDPYEILYAIRKGIQELTGSNNLDITYIGISISPGYLFAWNNDQGSPVTDCLMPNNSLSAHKFQEFKFSKFYNILSDHPDFNSTPNTALNLWVLANYYLKNKKNVIISGIDTWLINILTGYSATSIQENSNSLSELLFTSTEWDLPLIRSIELDAQHFPSIKTNVAWETKKFMPLKNNIPILYAYSSTQLLSNALSQFSNQPIACIHLSTVNHLYIENMPLKEQANHWIRFSSWHSFFKQFNIDTHLPNISFKDIDKAMLIPLNPFNSFNHQDYHFLNLPTIEKNKIKQLAILSILFVIKYCCSTFDNISKTGHIQHIVFSSSEWPESLIQLCIDLCQINGIEFSTTHWLDLSHACQIIKTTDFFSEASKRNMFKIKKTLLPSMDPLMSYSLYQPWESWFNKLYDLRR